MNGVFLKEGEQVEHGRPRDRRRSSSTCWKTSAQFDATEVERKVTAPDSNRKILEELKTYADEHEQRVRPLPEDADLRRQRPAAHLARRPARRPGPRRLRPGRRLRRARSPAASTGRCSASASSATGPNPGIVVTVDLLTTGVDIPTWSSSSSCGR